VIFLSNQLNRCTVALFGAVKVIKGHEYLLQCRLHSMRSENGRRLAQAPSSTVVQYAIIYCTHTHRCHTHGAVYRCSSGSTAPVGLFI